MSEFKFTEEQEQWLQDLESGKFKQAPRALCRIAPDGSRSYCCLGVAMERFHDGERDPLDDGADNPVIYRGDDGEEWTGILSEQVMDLLHFRGTAGELAEGKSLRVTARDLHVSVLTAANDCGASFADIAAFIRENPEAVFTQGA